MTPEQWIEHAEKVARMSKLTPIQILARYLSDKDPGISNGYLRHFRGERTRKPENEPEAL